MSHLKRDVHEGTWISAIPAGVTAACKGTFGNAPARSTLSTVSVAARPAGQHPYGILRQYVQLPGVKLLRLTRAATSSVITSDTETSA